MTATLTAPWLDSDEEDQSEASVDLFAHRGKAGPETRKVPKGYEDSVLDADLGYVPPKGDEIQRIEDMLSENDFATYRDMAKAIHKMVFEMVRSREWWTLYRGGNTFEGLEPTEGAIRRYGSKRFHPSQPPRIASINGPHLIESMEMAVRLEIEADESRAAFWRGGTCEECGHLGELHCEYLMGRPKSEDKNQPGKCTAPPTAGPSRSRGGAKAKTCGCDYALRQGVRR